MSDAAWTKVFHDDLLHGCRAANMSGVEIGVYCTCLWLIASRGAPIEFDSRWIAGFAGVTPRKATTIINKLATMPNKLVVRNGMIGNHKMLRTIAERDKKSDQARQAALARWHGDEKQLPLDQTAKKRGDKLPDNLSDNRQIIDPIKSNKRLKTAKTSDADASPPVRARDSETQNLNNTLPNTDSESVANKAARTGVAGQEKVCRLDDRDLWDWYQAVAEASGHNPVVPGQIDRAMGFVERWRADGISLEHVILPVIKATIAKTHDPTRTLGRFDAAIKHEHARHAATPEGKTYKPPPSPVLDPPDEDPLFRPIREALLKALGPHAYPMFLNDARFEVVEGAPQGKRVMRVNENRPGSLRLMDGERSSIVRHIARDYGFDEVW